MSFKPDNIEQDLTVKELLELILIELKVINLHQEVITDQKFKSEDTSK